MKIDIYLASPRWYCAGVTRAIEILNTAIKKFWTPIYVNHEIIHNKFVIDYFIKKGVIFEDNLECIPSNSILIFSAHGVWPKFIDKVKKRKIQFIDASCPLVIKVHNEAKNFLQKWYEIIYIWKNNHQEAIWIKEEASEKIHIISKKKDLESLKLIDTEKLALLNQTTLSVDDTKDLTNFIKEKYPNIVIPKSSDICYATTNRQNVVKKICQNINLLIIVGSKNSSNSNKLKEVGEKSKIKSILIDDYKELDESLLFDWIKIWISSGTSVPDKLVQWLIEFLKKRWGIVKEEFLENDEKIKFSSEVILQK